jgi:membrane-associated phospholipid phosphatase
VRLWIRIAVAGVLGAQPLCAQADRAVTKTFFSGRDAAIASGFLGASAGLSLFDARLAQFFQDSLYRHVRVGRKVDKLFSHINETTLTLGGLAVYGVARLTGEKTVADVAFHTSESVAAASLASQLIRGPLGRTRPINADKPFEDQYDFHFMRGFTHFQQRSFPSIHSSSGFAAASVLVAEVSRRDHGAAWLVGVPAYAIALTPGLSRMYLGQHWASDIFAGAFMGTFFGLRIVAYSHAHATTPLDRLFLGGNTSTRLGPAHGAVPIGWSLTF